MISERQRIEAPPSPPVENNTPPPPSYEEVNGVFASQTHNGCSDGISYFLGEVSNSVCLGVRACVQLIFGFLAESFLSL